MAMKHGNDRYGVPIEVVANDIGKPSHECLADGTVTYSVDFRCCGNSLKRFLNLREELGSQTASLVIVPTDSIFEVVLSRCVDNNWERHYLSSSLFFTSSHVEAV